MLDINKKAFICREELLSRFIEGTFLRPAMLILKPLAGIFLTLLSIAVLWPSLSFADTVEVEILHFQDKYPAGGSYPILVTLHISDTWYIHGSEESGGDLIPTELSFPEDSGVSIEGIQFPSPSKKMFDYSEEPLEIFSGDLLVGATVKVSKKAPPGNIMLKGELSYQACAAQFCLPPERIQIPFKLTIAPAGAQITPLNQQHFAKNKNLLSHTLIPAGTGFWLTLFVIFLGGMALNLTPCIYPLIPITVSYFGGKSNEIQGRTLAHGILYVAGLSISNSMLGLTASLTGGMIGFILQKPVFLILVAGILGFLALSFFDLWEFKLPSGLNRLASKNFGGYFGTFFMGLTLGIVAAPCLGPFMLGLLTYVAQKGDPFLGFLYFFVLSIGMGLPLAVLAVFSGALKNLPMSGGWLMWIRRALGWVLFGMAGYIIMPLISTPAGKSTLIAVIIGAAGLHLGWLDRNDGGMRLFPYVKKGLGVILLFVAAAFLLVTPSKEGVKWSPYDPVAIKEAVDNRKPVILDFYADWCSPCRALDKKVFADPDVVEMSHKFVTIRVDLTTEHPDQDELQKRYKIKGVPTIVFINRKGVIESERIESFVDSDVVLKRMKRLVEES